MPDQNAQYIEQLLATHANGSADPAAIRTALANMATPGYDWEMFTAAGNAACSTALATVLPRIDGIRDEADLISTFGHLIANLVRAGHTEVGDTEPENHMQDAANLIGLLRGFTPVSRYTFVDYYGHVLDELGRVAREAREAAIAVLIDAHRDEFEQLLAQETQRLS